MGLFRKGRHSKPKRGKAPRHGSVSAPEQTTPSSDGSRVQSQAEEPTGLITNISNDPEAAARDIDTNYARARSVQRDTFGRPIRPPR